MPKPLYKIRNWADTFEVSQTKKQPTAMNWVPMPTRMDGKRYRRIVEHSHAAAIFGCWMLMVEIAARRPLARRGYLEDSDGPMDAEDLSSTTGLTVENFRLAIEVLSSEGIMWLVLDNDGALLEQPVVTSGTGLKEKKRQKEKEKIETSDFRVDVDRFRAEYPSECSDWDVQILLSEIRAQNEQDLLFTNLALYRETDKWRGGFCPSAENFLRKGIWKVQPKAPVVKSAASRSRLGASVAHLLGDG